MKAQSKASLSLIPDERAKIGLNNYIAALEDTLKDDTVRLLTIIKNAPSPFGKTDSELAQAYKSWYLTSRFNLKAAEQVFEPKKDV